MWLMTVAVTGGPPGTNPVEASADSRDVFIRVPRMVDGYVINYGGSPNWSCVVHLHIEREGLTVPMFRFAAAMPALTRLTGLDEFGDDGPMPPAEVDQVRAMLPHISMD